MGSNRTTPFFLVVACVGVAASAGPTSATLYDVKFRLTQDVTVEALRFSENYTAAGGEFVGVSENVDCVPDSSINAVAAFNDMEASNTLQSSLIKTSGSQLPESPEKPGRFRKTEQYLL